MIFDKIEFFRAYNPDKQYGFLLSATLFQGLQYSFDMTDNKNQQFIVKIPKELSTHRTFEVKSLQGQLYAQLDGVLIQDSTLKPRIITNYSQIFENDIEI